MQRTLKRYSPYYIKDQGNLAISNTNLQRFVRFSMPPSLKSLQDMKLIRILKISMKKSMRKRKP